MAKTIHIWVTQVFPDNLELCIGFDGRVLELGEDVPKDRRGSSGGVARAAKLSAEERSAIARNAAKKRWANKSGNNNASVIALEASS